MKIMRSIRHGGYLMKNMYRALALSAMALSGPALAADLPTRRAPPVYVPPPVPVFTWTGFYAGGQVGYGFGEDRALLNLAAGLPAGIAVPGGLPPVFYGSRPEGVIGGAHIGYNYQFGNGMFGGGGLVLGVEGSVDGSDNRATGDVGTALGAAFGVAGVPAGALTNTVRKDIEGSARGRIGIAVDRALFYATGGAAFAQFHSSYNVALGALIPGAAGIGLNLGNYAHTRVGWTIGGGVEYAVTPNWTLRAEYRYTDFGTFTDPVLGGVAGLPAAGLPVSHRETDQRVQVGFSYLFASPIVAPVVARY